MAVQAKPGAIAGADEYNAFFYTLVSTDTQVDTLLQPRISAVANTLMCPQV